MSEEQYPLTIEQAAFDRFMAEYKSTSPQHLRLGQAFYNHFNLHKMTKQHLLQGVYEMDGEEAMKVIEAITLFQ